MNEKDSSKENISLILNEQNRNPNNDKATNDIRRIYVNITKDLLQNSQSENKDTFSEVSCDRNQIKEEIYDNPSKLKSPDNSPRNIPINLSYYSKKYFSIKDINSFNIQEENVENLKEDAKESNLFSQKCFNIDIIRSTRNIVNNNIIKNILSQNILNKIGNKNLKFSDDCVNTENKKPIVSSPLISILSNNKLNQMPQNKKPSRSSTLSTIYPKPTTSFISSQQMGAKKSDENDQNALQPFHQQQNSKQNNQLIKPKILEIDCTQAHTQFPPPLSTEQLKKLIEELEQKKDKLIIQVTCGNTKGLLDLKKLAMSPKVNSVLSAQGWATPNQFQRWCGRGKARDWKRSIRHGLCSLKSLLHQKIITLQPPMCWCAECKAEMCECADCKVEMASNIQTKESSSPVNLSNAGKGKCIQHTEPKHNSQNTAQNYLEILISSQTSSVKADSNTQQVTKFSATFTQFKSTVINQPKNQALDLSASGTKETSSVLCLSSKELAKMNQNTFTSKIPIAKTTFSPNNIEQISKQYEKPYSKYNVSPYAGSYHGKSSPVNKSNNQKNKLKLHDIAEKLKNNVCKNKINDIEPKLPKTESIKKSPKDFNVENIKNLLSTIKSESNQDNSTIENLMKIFTSYNNDTKVTSCTDNYAKGFAVFSDFVSLNSTPKISEKTSRMTSILLPKSTTNSTIISDKFTPTKFFSNATFNRNGVRADVGNVEPSSNGAAEIDFAKRTAKKRNSNEASSITTRQNSKKNLKDSEHYENLEYPITKRRKVSKSFGTKLTKVTVENLLGFHEDEVSLFNYILKNDPEWQDLHNYPLDASKKCERLKRENHKLNEKKRKSLLALENEREKLKSKLRFVQLLGLRISDAGKKALKLRNLDILKKYWILMKS